MDQDRLLETAVRAARKGGQIALEGLGRPGPIQWKGAQDVRTPTTLAVQEAIIEIIRQEFPEHAILSEELAEQPDPQAEFLWIIDPIDGSLNYIKGIPFFAVSIGLRQKNIYRLGVIYDPCRDELFQALYHKGAYLNSRRIRTQAPKEGIEAYQAATVATDWPAHRDKRATNAMIIRLMASDVVSLQILGSPALALCYIAAGRLDAYFHLDLHLWDVAAASVVLQEGGGVLTDEDGSTWFHSEGGYVATNGVIHGWMLHPIRLVRDQQKILVKP
jgi:myo-inositol-1(or 4)-monophosphatase